MSLRRRLRHRPLGVAGLAGAAVFVGAAVVGPWVAPFDPLALSQATLLPPGAPYWLGTDDLGRDVLSGILHGARISLLVGLLSAAGAVLIGISVGAAAGYLGGAPVPAPIASRAQVARRSASKGTPEGSRAGCR